VQNFHHACLAAIAYAEGDGFSAHCPTFNRCVYRIGVAHDCDGNLRISYDSVTDGHDKYRDGVVTEA